MSKLLTILILAAGIFETGHTIELDSPGIIRGFTLSEEEELLPRRPSFDEIDRLYCYSIKEVSPLGGSITLEDDSVWDISLFSMSAVSNWKSGEKVALWSEGGSLPKPFTIFNLARRESASASLDALPNKYSPKGLWMTHTGGEGALIFLNNGLALFSPYGCFHNGYFIEGIRLFLLSTIEEGEPRYSLWMENGVVAIDLELVP